MQNRYPNKNIKNDATMRTKRDPRLQNYARELRKKMTDAERCLWHALWGGQHATQQNYDTARSAFLQNKGFRVLRFWNHDDLQHTDAVLTEILQYCQTPP